MEILKNRCPANHKCPSVNVCPVNAIKQEGIGVPTIDESICIKCNKCVNYCPMGVFQPE